MRVRGLLVVLVYLFSCGTPSEDSKTRAIKFMKPCFPEEEFLNLCTDPTDSCHEDRANEIKLLRLDGVKVWILVKLTSCFIQRFSSYSQEKRTADFNCESPTQQIPAVYLMFIDRFLNNYNK